MVQARNARGFTLIEVLVVIAIIGLLAGILVPTIATARRRARQGAASMALKSVVQAIEQYKTDWGVYPPDSGALGQFGMPASGPAGCSETLWYRLCTRATKGDMHCGPYLENLGADRLRKDPDGSEKKRLCSPLGGFYLYMVLNDPQDREFHSFLLVDAGLDGLWGGSISRDSGWNSDNSDSNQDGAIDDADNIFSTSPLKAQ